jgi:hypothetical protein
MATPRAIAATTVHTAMTVPTIATLRPRGVRLGRGDTTAADPSVAELGTSSGRACPDEEIDPIAIRASEGVALWRVERARPIPLDESALGGASISWSF